MFRFRYLLLLVSGLALLACGETKEKRSIEDVLGARSLLNWQTPASMLKLKPGDSLKLAWEWSGEQSVTFQLEFNDLNVAEELPLEPQYFAFQVPPNTHPGLRKLRLSARDSKGFVLETSDRSIEVLSDKKPTNLEYMLVRTLPHDPDAFTQGLLVDEGFFLEGTGLNGKSTLRRVDINTGKVQNQVAMSQEFFGEGIAVMGNKLYQLTWQNHACFVYDKHTFQKIKQFYIPTEGWGLASDGQQLVMSNGTEFIFVIDTNTFQSVRTFSVYDDKGPVKGLNELEFIEGLIWANIYQTDKIAIIDPATGKVLSYLNLEGILPAKDETDETDVLNGIAYDAQNKRIYVTGKNWPKLFEIKVKGKIPSA